MCIRDSFYASPFVNEATILMLVETGWTDKISVAGRATFGACLLYTSDAADERSSVDLGGRRIIKKKKI